LIWFLSAPTNPIPSAAPGVETFTDFVSGVFCIWFLNAPTSPIPSVAPGVEIFTDFAPGILCISFLSFTIACSAALVLAVTVIVWLVDTCVVVFVVS
jgi:hypothetical protein